MKKIHNRLTCLHHIFKFKEDKKKINVILEHMHPTCLMLYGTPAAINVDKSTFESRYSRGFRIFKFYNIKLNNMF